MYKVIFIILAFHFSLSVCGQKTRTIKEKRAGKQVVEKFDVLRSDEKIRHGDYEMFFNRISIVRGQYQNGKRHGYWQFGTVSDSVYCFGHYVNGKKDSSWTYFYLNETASQLEFSKGRIKNVSAFYPDNRSSYEAFFDSSGTGKVTSFYNNGNTREVIPVVEYHIHGIAKAYHFNGQLFQKIEYHRGTPVNVLTRLDADGVELTETELKKGTGIHQLYYVNTDNEQIIAKIIHYRDSLKDGKYVEFNKKGDIKTLGQYKKGVKSGIWTYYNVNGSRERNFTDEPEEHHIPSHQNDNHYYAIFDAHHKDVRKAKFPGGDVALMRFLSNTIQFPNEARKSKSAGICLTSFDVSPTGEIYNGRALETPHPSLSRVAVNSVLSMPNWQPALVFGVPVVMQFNIPIKFTLVN